MFQCFVHAWNHFQPLLTKLAVAYFDRGSYVSLAVSAHLATIPSILLAGKQASKQTSKQASKQASKQTNKQTSKQANKQASKQANKQASKQASKQTNKQTNKQASKQANKQTNIHTMKTTKGIKPFWPSCHHLVLPRDPSPHSLRCLLYAGNTPALVGNPIRPRCQDGSGGPTNPQCDALTWHLGCLPMVHSDGGVMKMP